MNFEQKNLFEVNLRKCNNVTFLNTFELDKIVMTQNSNFM
jgi:hypothetical protein